MASMWTEGCRWVAAVVMTIMLIKNADVRGDTELDSCSKCKFTKHKSRDYGAEERLKPICGKRFNVKNEKYIFYIGICVPAEHETTLQTSSSAVTQRKLSDVNSAPYIIGDLNSTEIMSGTNWINLEYEDGDHYGNSCNGEMRRANIMIICLPGEMTGVAKILLENHNKTGDCYYSFELGHDAACTKTNVNTGLSAGTIICIVLSCIVGVYLIVGGLYMRCVLGAKGWNQIPNYEFWKDFGNLQADGCDLVCRCGSKDRGSHMYHGIGDHQIESANDDSHDEHLLPM